MARTVNHTLRNYIVYAIAYTRLISYTVVLILYLVGLTWIVIVRSSSHLFHWLPCVVPGIWPSNI